MEGEAVTAPLASLVRRLAAEGCTGEQIAVVVEQEEQRRARETARKRKYADAKVVKSVKRQEMTENDDWPDDFRDWFWSHYPHKIAKADAIKKLETLRKSRKVTWAALMAGLARYASKTDDRPWCNPATWLNQQRWTDEPANGGRNGHRASPVGSAFDDLIARSEGLGSPSGDEPADDGPHAGPQGR